MALNEMNADTLLEITTYTPEQTQALGQCIGKVIQTGLVIKLVGDLGSGKTCFVKGLAKGLEVPEGYEITSPTYALIHDFPARMPFFHVDLYRIHDAFDAESIGLWEIVSQQAVVAVEWADRLEENLWPPESLEVRFKAMKDDRRHIRLFGCGLQMTNLIKETGTLWQNEVDNSFPALK